MNYLKNEYPQTVALVLAHLDPKRASMVLANLGEEQKDMSPLFQTILDHVPPPFAKPDDPFHMLVSNIDWSDYVGRIAVGKILGGSCKIGDPVFVIRNADGVKVKAKITKVSEFTGLGTVETPEGKAGNIVGLSGFEDIDIGGGDVILEIDEGGLGIGAGREGVSRAAHLRRGAGGARGGGVVLASGASCG